MNSYYDKEHEKPPSKSKFKCRWPGCTKTLASESSRSSHMASQHGHLTTNHWERFWEAQDVLPSSSDTLSKKAGRRKRKQMVEIGKGPSESTQRATSRIVRQRIPFANKRALCGRPLCSVLFWNMQQTTSWRMDPLQVFV